MFDWVLALSGQGDCNVSVLLVMMSEVITLYMMKIKEGIKSNCDGVQLALPILYLMMSTMKKERCAESLQS